jgi:hypothetical protein
LVFPPLHVFAVWDEQPFQIQLAFFKLDWRWIWFFFFKCLFLDDIVSCFYHLCFFG